VVKEYVEQGQGHAGSNAFRVSAKLIVGRQNSSAGGALGQFYKRERVLDLGIKGTLPFIDFLRRGSEKGSVPFVSSVVHLDSSTKESAFSI
jgi:hypothetical protein